MTVEALDYVYVIIFKNMNLLFHAPVQQAALSHLTCIKCEEEEDEEEATGVIFRTWFVLVVFERVAA